MNAPLPRPIRGIVPPMVTPLSGPDTLDIPGLERLVEHILGGGVHGLFLLGTTGEAPSLSYRLRRELVSRACRQVNGRIPVLVGITDTSSVESIRVAEWAAESGAQAVVLSAPYYFPAGQPELLEYLQRLAPRLPLPVFLYNMPAMTKIVFEPETIRRAMEIPQVAGLKDSSGNTEYFRKVREITRARKDWSLLVGPEHLLSQTMDWGGDGGVCGGANVLPRLFVDLYEACEAKDSVRRTELEKAVSDLGRLYTIGSHSSAIIKGIKCALSILGICEDGMAEPFSPFAEPERRRIREIVETLGTPTLQS